MEADVISAAIAIVTAVSGLAIYFHKLKTKLTQFRQFIDLIDDALSDNTITEKEYQSIWEAGKKLLKLGE